MTKRTKDEILELCAPCRIIRHCVRVYAREGCPAIQHIIKEAEG